MTANLALPFHKGFFAFSASLPSLVFWSGALRLLRLQASGCGSSLLSARLGEVPSVIRSIQNFRMKFVGVSFLSHIVLFLHNLGWAGAGLYFSMKFVSLPFHRFAVSWVLDTIPKLTPLQSETYKERLKAV